MWLCGVRSLFSLLTLLSLCSLTFYVVGALFTISPILLCTLAVVFGLTWPTWVQDFYDRTERFIDDMRARGRGEDTRKGGSGSVGKKSGRYHYYIRQNGQKRYYRTGLPWLGTATAAAGKSKGDNKKRQSLLRRKKNNASKNNQQWGIFGRT